LLNSVANIPGSSRDVAILVRSVDDGGDEVGPIDFEQWRVHPVRKMKLETVVEHPHIDLFDATLRSVSAISQRAACSLVAQGPGR